MLMRVAHWLLNTSDVTAGKILAPHPSMELPSPGAKRSRLPGLKSRVCRNPSEKGPFQGSGPEGRDHVNDPESSFEKTGFRKSSSNSFIRLLSSTIEMCGPEHRVLWRRGHCLECPREPQRAGLQQAPRIGTGEGGGGRGQDQLHFLTKGRKNSSSSSSPPSSLSPSSPSSLSVAIPGGGSLLPGYQVRPVVWRLPSPSVYLLTVGQWESHSRVSSTNSKTIC